jgi:hypothetical protein
MSENVGASTSRNPKGLHSLYRDNFTIPLCDVRIPSLVLERRLIFHQGEVSRK